MSESEVQYRFFNYYSHDNSKIVWQPGFYEKYLKRMQSLAMFMGELDRRLAAWYNTVYHFQKFGEKRRGHFWQDRFKSNVIESRSGLRKCVAYIEFNPVRANLCQTPSDYNFCSFGAYKGSGRHPFQENFTEYFLEEDCINPLSEKEKFNNSINFLEEVFVNSLRTQKFLSELDARKAMQDNPFGIISRRVRYWTDCKIVMCKLKKSDLEENVYQKQLKARKVVHQYKDKLGNIIIPYSWHKLLPEPES